MPDELIPAPPRRTFGDMVRAAETEAGRILLHHPVDSPYGPRDEPDPSWLSHTDRINPGTNAADIPGQGPLAMPTAESNGSPLTPAPAEPVYAERPNPPDVPDKTYTLPPDTPALTHPPGATPPGHIPLILQENNMPTDQARAAALDHALALGGSGEVVLANAQAFYQFLSGGNDAPPVVGPPGPPGPVGGIGPVGPSGAPGIAGQIGPTGPTGPAGPSAAATSSFAGASGPSGATGAGSSTIHD